MGGGGMKNFEVFLGGMKNFPVILGGYEKIVHLFEIHSAPPTRDKK